MEPMLVVLEGIDGAGKTTLWKALGEATNHEVILVDRMGISNRVYDKLYGRVGAFERAKKLRAMDEVLAREAGLVIIFLDTSPEVCHAREVEKSWCPHSVAELTAQRELFLEEFAAMEVKVPVFTLPTEGISLEQAVEMCVIYLEACSGLSDARLLCGHGHMAPGHECKRPEYPDNCSKRCPGFELDIGGEWGR